MDLGLAGTTAVVTGASKGIGLAVTRALSGAGATVFAGARKSSPELDDLAAAGGVQPVEVDLSDPDGPAALVVAAGRTVDVLVNNVGSAPARPGGFLSITDEQWLATLNLDLMAAVRACRAVLPGMLEAGSGSIVTICSVNARCLTQAYWITASLKPGWPDSARRCRKKSGLGGSGSIPSAQVRSPPTSGWEQAVSRGP